MFYKLILLLFITNTFMAKESLSFVYRYISDPKEYCQKKTARNIEVCTNYNHLPINKGDEARKLILGLDKDLLSDYRDVLNSDKISQKIILQAKEKILEFKGIRKDLEKNKEIKKDSDIYNINQNVQALSSIDYRLSLLKKRSPKCFLDKKTSCSQKEKKYFKEKIKPLLEQKAKLISYNPILSQKDITEFINNAVNKRLSKHKDLLNQNHNCIQNKKIKKLFTKNTSITCKKRKTLSQNRIKDFKFHFLNNEVKNYLSPAIKTATKSVDDLKKRHQRLHEKIRNTLYKKKKRQLPLTFRIKGLRKAIFHNRDITTDYFTTLNQSEIGEDNDGGNQFFCSIIKENQANNINATINSVAIDAATLLIPLGSPFLISKVVNSFGKLSKVANLQSKTVVTTEIMAMGLDTQNISDEENHCRSIQERAAASESIPKHLKKEYKRCKDVLNKVTISYVMAMLGGGLTTLSDVKKLLPIRKIRDDEIITLSSEEIVKNQKLRPQYPNKNYSVSYSNTKRDYNRRADHFENRGLYRERRYNGKERRSLDNEQREFINKLEKELGGKKAKLLNKYNPNNNFSLDNRDQIYLAGYAELLEKELKAAGKTGNELDRTVKKRIIEMMKNCKKVSK